MLGIGTCPYLPHVLPLLVSEAIEVKEAELVVQQPLGVSLQHVADDVWREVGRARNWMEAAKGGGFAVTVSYASCILKQGC